MKPYFESALLKLIRSSLPRAVRGFLALLVALFYVLGAGQAIRSNIFNTSREITVTHTHHHHHDEDHDHDHYDHEDHHSQNNQQARHEDGIQPNRPHDDGGGAHSHTIVLLSAPAVYLVPLSSQLVFIESKSSVFSLSCNQKAPLSPSLGSIFRPPIV